MDFETRHIIDNNLFTSLKRTVEKTDTKIGRAFDFTIQFLIILSLVTFSISTLPDLSAATLQILYILQVTTVSIFTFEYFLRIIVADKKLNYIFSFYGIIDFLAILPFYLTIAIDLRAIRVIRLLRLFRLLKFARYNKAIARFRQTFSNIKEEIIIFLFATLFLLYISAVGIYYFENAAQPEHFKSIFHSLWWAVATLTTVGYGDVFPITLGGKIFTFFILMIGLSVVSVPAGLLASALKETAKNE